MAEVKLLSLLKTLNAYELNRFGKFLSSPYFNEDERLKACYKTLREELKNEQPEPDKKKVWKAVYGGAKFNNLKFARLYSDLGKKLDEFFAHDGLRNTVPEKLNAVVAAYNERKLVRYFPEAYKLAIRRHLGQKLRDADFYLAHFKLEAASNAYLELQNRRGNEKNIIESLNALDNFYFIQKLNYLAALLHYKRFLSTEGETALAAELLQYFKKHPPVVPAVAINYCIVLSLLEPENEKHFSTLKKLLAEHFALFKKDTARNFYAFTINFCIRKINSGKLSFVQELFELYKEMLQKKLMTDEHDMLSQFDFKNMVTVALRAGQEGWTETFIRDYRNSIAPEGRKNAYTFNLARLYFYQRKFNKVLPLLQDVEYSDIFYQLDSKTTLMKTYYELGEYLPLMALKESFRILLRRKKIISEQNRNNYMNFIRFTMKLYRADVKDQKRIAALTEAIRNSNNVADKTWLLEKVNELTA